MAKGEGDRPFPTRSPLHFYCGMLGRYRRYLAGLALFTVIFAGLSTLRLVSIGLVLDSVKIRLGGEDDGGEGLRPNAGGGDTVKTLDKIKEWLLPGQFPPLEETLRSQEGFENFVLATVVALCLLALALGVTLFIKDTLTIKMVARVLVETRQVLFNHLTRQPVSFFHDRRAGDLISRVTNDVEMLHIALTHLFQTLLQQPVLALWSLGLAFWASPFLFMVSIPMFVLMVIPVFRAARKIVRHGRRRQQKLGMITEALQQLFGGIRTVKAFGMEKHERQAFEEKNRGFGRALRKMAQARITGRAFQESFYNLGLAGLFLLGGWLLTSETDRLSVGRFFIFILAMIQVYTPVKAATKAYNKVQEARAGVERVLEILRTPPALTDREGARDFPGLRERIRFENVSFSYDAQPRSGPDHDTATSVPAAETDGRAALEEIDLEVEKGQVLALVGPSGAGKSTVVDLVARFYEPQSGVIRVDGVDVREYRHESYLERIGIVSQDPFLFNATIRENIRYGLEGASDAAVVDAAKAANAHEFILQQPQGYDTEIGDRGVKLSGGQRQRLTIARALLKNVPILILDEATSALDSEAEREVQKAIDNLIRERTVFVIAHRLSTVVRADKIVVLEDGRIVEHGRHEELLEKRGRYFELYTSQSGNAD